MLVATTVLVGVAVSSHALSRASDDGGRYALPAPLNTHQSANALPMAVAQRESRQRCRPLAGATYGNGGVSYLPRELRRVQSALDHHLRCYGYYRNPVKVTVRDLPRYGFSGSPLTVVSPPPPHIAPTAHHGEDGLPETDVVVSYRGRRFWIVLNQFERHGPGGIWAIITITPF
jgi:hypothetical protein